MVDTYSKEKSVSADSIAKVVKQTLKDMGHGKTAIAFELFVDLKNKVKNIKSLVDAEQLVEGYIKEADWRVKENSKGVFMAGFGASYSFYCSS